MHWRMFISSWVGFRERMSSRHQGYDHVKYYRLENGWPLPWIASGEPCSKIISTCAINSAIPLQPPQNDATHLGGSTPPPNGLHPFTLTAVRHQPDLLPGHGKGHPLLGHTYPTSVTSVSKALLQEATPNSRQQTLH